MKGERGGWEELLKTRRRANASYTSLSGADEADSDAIPDIAGGEGGHGTAKPEGVTRRDTFFLARRDRLTSPLRLGDRSIRETVMDSFPAIPRNVKHAGGDFSAAGQALAAAGNVCLM